MFLTFIVMKISQQNNNRSWNIARPSFLLSKQLLRLVKQKTIVYCISKVVYPKYA